LQEGFVTFAIAARAFEGCKGIDAGDEEAGVDGDGGRRKRDPSLRSG